MGNGRSASFEISPGSDRRRRNEIFVSAASFWEIAIKKHVGRIRIDLEELNAATDSDGFEELPVRISHTTALQALPDHHRDPFDRLLIAQSIAEHCRLVTRDETILRYSGAAGFHPF